MRDLAEVYTAGWFRARAGYRRPYHAFARAIDRIWRPRSLLDVGCGAGYIVEHFADRIPVLGVDGSASALAVLSDEAQAHCLLRDLTRPPDFAPHHEFAVSIEVAEHIPATHVGAYMAWFAGAHRVFFTAAPPGQGGLDHVNEQPADYWRRRFERLGFVEEGDSAAAWRSIARSLTRACPWVVRNAMFFQRRS
jgi:SAM-dependent methyltransferase